MTLPLNRAAFVRKTEKLVFKQGLLVEHKVNKPSEALAVASWPVDALKTIASIPAEWIQLKIDTTNRDTQLINAQKALIDAQTALIEARSKALEAQAEGDEE